MPKVSLNYENGVQKGPATDYSMLLQMKRRSIIVADERSNIATGSKSNFIDTYKNRGFTNGVIPFYVTRGATLGFLKF